MTSSTWAVLNACGKEETIAENTCTAFLNLNNRPVLSYSLAALEHAQDIDAVVVVAPRDRLEQVVSVIQLFGCHKIRKVVPGASTELASLNAAMNFVEKDAGLILFHEASRPGITQSGISELVRVAKRQGIAATGQACNDRLALAAKNGTVESLLQAGTAWFQGSPVVFKRESLQKVLNAAKKKSKAVSSVLDAIVLSKQKIRLVTPDKFPERISSFEQLRAMEIDVTP